MKKQKIYLQLFADGGEGTLNQSSAGAQAHRHWHKSQYDGRKNR